MLRSSPELEARIAPLCCLLLGIAPIAAAQKTIHCPDGDHVLIDVKQIAIQYDASSFAGTLSSLSVLGARLEVVPTKLQEAATATQQWDEFLKGLAAGYNTCAVTKQQYADGLNRIYPRLKEDAIDLEAIRKIISEGQKTDEKRLQSLVESYYGNLRRFAEISGTDVILERIDAAKDELSKQQKADTAAILAKIEETAQRNRQAPLPTPAEVGSEVSEIGKELLANADEAEKAYNQGYALLDQYRFHEAIPYLQRALAAVPLPDFYLALGHAYWELPDLAQAESVLRQGLTALTGKNDERHEASLANLLGLTIQDKGDLDGALTYARRALKIEEKVHGPEHPDVAAATNNIGRILQAKGDLEGALTYTQRALKINEKVYGLDHPDVARDANNIGQILWAKADLDGALTYTQRALKIDEKVYGPEHPDVAAATSNIGQILKDKGDLDGALTYTQRALKIDEKVYGPNHPIVATLAGNIGQILQAKGDLDGALTYTQRALKINEKVYGLDHPDVARDANNIGQILKDKGDLDGALTYTQRALKIAEKVYGPDRSDVAIYANNIGQILKDKGDLDGALTYTQRAPKIAEKVYGPDRPDVAIYANNIGQILWAKGDLDGALTYTQRALKIDEKVYGPDHPTVAIRANNIGLILQDKGDLDGALTYTQRAVKIDKKVFGPDNPTTKAMAANLERIKAARAVLKTPP
jgi:tetratricopeptide (TPR) repeat protein